MIGIQGSAVLYSCTVLALLVGLSSGVLNFVFRQNAHFKRECWLAVRWWRLCLQAHRWC